MLSRFSILAGSQLLVGILIVGCSAAVPGLRDTLSTTSTAAATGVCAGTPVTGGFQTGDGTSSNAFVICNADQLNHFASYCTYVAPSNCSGLNFQLGADIDLANTPYIPVNYFSGTFDGNSKTVSNWVYGEIDPNATSGGGGTIESDGALPASLRNIDYNVGFFRQLGTTATVKNLNLTNIAVIGRMFTGGLVGHMFSGATIDHCHVSTAGGNEADVMDRNYTKGMVLGYQNFSSGGNDGHTGGLIGTAENGTTLSNSSFTGLVRSSQHVGGLVGDALGINITNSYTTGASYSSDGNHGGLVGAWESSSVGFGISNSFSTMTITATASGGGGLVGTIRAGFITNSYYMGTVNGNSGYTGGFIGSAGGPNVGALVTISKCFALANVEGSTFVGGFLGQSLSGGHITISDSYYIGNVAFTSGNAGGFIGEIANAFTTLNRVYAAGTLIDNSNGTGTGAAVTKGALVGTITLASAVNDSFADLNLTSAALVGTTNSGVIDGVSSVQSTVNMQTATTYSANTWDFNTVWTVAPGVNGGYPTLR